MVGSPAGESLLPARESVGVACREVPDTGRGIPEIEDRWLLALMERGSRTTWTSDMVFGWEGLTG